MEITRIRMLRGPNLWSRHTALEAIVSCDESERSIDSIPQFESKIRERFPQLGSMRRGGQNEVLSLAHALEHAALGLQAQAGCPVTFSRAVQTIDVGVYQVVVEYTEEVVGRMAFDFAFALKLNSLAVVDSGRYFDFDILLLAAARFMIGNTQAQLFGRSINGIIKVDCYYDLNIASSVLLASKKHIKDVVDTATSTASKIEPDFVGVEALTALEACERVAAAIASATSLVGTGRMTELVVGLALGFVF